MRILMVSNHFFPSVGGLEVSALRLATALVNKGVKVSVLTPRYKGFAQTELVGQIPIWRFRVMGSPHVRYGVFSKLVYAMSASAYLMRHRREYDLIHVHQALYVAVVSAVVGRILKKPVIVKVAGSGVNGNVKVLRSFFLGNLMLKGLRKADKFISLSDEINQELVDHGFEKSKICIIPNGIDLGDFDFTEGRDLVKQRLGIQRSRFIALYVGRLGLQKHVIKLIHAWKSIVDNDSSAVLLVAGDGPDKEKLVEAVRDKNLSDQVLFFGNVLDVRRLHGVSDVFILPSDSEGMSNALLEAQAAEVPCVASRQDGNISMIADGETGLLFDLADIEDMKAKIMFVKNNPLTARQYAIRAKDRVLKRYKIEIVADAYIQIYRDLIMHARQGFK